MQQYIDRNNVSRDLHCIISENRIKTILVVCGKSFLDQRVFGTIKDTAKNSSVSLNIFSNFSVNPKMEEAEQAVAKYDECKDNLIIGAGGGSALDVAKYVAIKREALFFAIPTTAGTGSEATPFAVLYKNSEKMSVSDSKGLPKYVLLDGDNVLSLPRRQKIATMCDALSHAVEAIWSVNATGESVGYSQKSISMIQSYREGYLNNERDSLQGMLEAANIAGKAIAIARTTASHALAYKLTTKFGFAHGEAVMLTLPEVCKYMVKGNEEQVITKMNDLREGFRANTNMDVVDILYGYKRLLNLKAPSATDSDLAELCRSVNVERLANFPIKLKERDIETIYRVALNNEDDI